VRCDKRTERRQQLLSIVEIKEYDSMLKKAIILTLVLSLAVIAVAGCDPTGIVGDAVVDGNNESIRWLTDHEEAIEQAQAQNKPILVNFYTDACPYCRLLDQQTYTDKELIEFLNTNFINLRDYAGRSPLYRVYGVWSVPTTLFNTPDGYHERYKISSYKGFMSPEVFYERAQAALDMWQS
jgi:thiol:disulfide interchange protein